MVTGVLGVTLLGSAGCTGDTQSATDGSAVVMPAASQPDGAAPPTELSELPAERSGSSTRTSEPTQPKKVKVAKPKPVVKPSVDRAPAGSSASAPSADSG